MSALAERIAALLENPPHAWIRHNANQPNGKVYEVGTTRPEPQTVSTYATVNEAEAFCGQLQRQMLIEEIDDVLREHAERPHIVIGGGPGR